MGISSNRYDNFARGRGSRIAKAAQPIGDICPGSKTCRSTKSVSVLSDASSRARKTVRQSTRLVFPAKLPEDVICWLWRRQDDPGQSASCRTGMCHYLSWLRQYQCPQLEHRPGGMINKLLCRCGIPAPQTGRTLPLRRLDPSMVIPADSGRTFSLSAWNGAQPCSRARALVFLTAKAWQKNGEQNELLGPVRNYKFMKWLPATKVGIRNLMAGKFPDAP